MKKGWMIFGVLLVIAAIFGWWYFTIGPGAEDSSEVTITVEGEAVVPTEVPQVILPTATPLIKSQRELCNIHALDQGSFPLWWIWIPSHSQCVFIDCTQYPDGWMIIVDKDLRYSGRRAEPQEVQAYCPHGNG